MSDSRAEHNPEDAAAVYELLRIDTVDLAREPANLWPILVKKHVKEQSMSAETQSPPAAPTPGVTLEGLAAQLSSLSALFQAEIAVKKDSAKPKPAQSEVTFRRGEQGQILVAKQVGVLPIAQLSVLAEMARPALAHLEEVTVPFVPGAEVKMDQTPAAGDPALLAVQKETQTAVKALGEQFAEIAKALKVAKSGQAPSDAQTHSSTTGAGDTPNVQDNPEAYLPPHLQPRKG